MSEWSGPVSDATEIEDQRGVLVLTQTRNRETCSPPCNLRTMQRKMMRKSTSVKDFFTVFLWITSYNLFLFIFLDNNISKQQFEDLSGDPSVYLRNLL